MTDETIEHDFVLAVAQTLERLQIKPEDLFGYVMWLRARYSACVEALREVEEHSDDDMASSVARQALVYCGIMEEDVSHETNQA